MFTALPVPRRWHDRAAPDQAPAALGWLPVVGAGVAALAGLVGTAVLWRDRSLVALAAAVSVAALCLLTRGLHLDGLADTADGLGSRAEPARALQIMRQPDIGPFGVATVVLVLLVEVAALAAVPYRHLWAPLAALVAAAATGRIAAVHAALPRIGAARPDGFGALVAGRVGHPHAVLATVSVLAAGAALAASVHASVPGWVAGQAGALVVAWLLRTHATRRLGGVTGDVFGALVESTTMLTLVAFALAG
jgi:adenosylcobinamide-GDP ribazoletransferase